jgi:soluble lytic murein transglycosylase-like protein
MTGRLGDLWPIIVHVAARHDLEPELVAAVVLTESAGIPEAVRYEPRYRWLHHPERVRPRLSSLATETEGQKTSWGLMQVMGGVAREQGFQGWFPALCRPAEGLEWGCRYLARLIVRFGSVEAGVSAYNQGSPRRGPDGRYRNQAYVDRVMMRRRRLAARKGGRHAR